MWGNKICTLTIILYYPNKFLVVQFPSIGFCIINIIHIFFFRFDQVAELNNFSKISFYPTLFSVLENEPGFFAPSYIPSPFNIFLFWDKVSLSLLSCDSPCFEPPSVLWLQVWKAMSSSNYYYLCSTSCLPTGTF